MMQMHRPSIAQISVFQVSVSKQKKVSYYCYNGVHLIGDVCDQVGHSRLQLHCESQIDDQSDCTLISFVDQSNRV